MVKALTLAQQKEELTQAAEAYLEFYRRHQGAEEVEAEPDVQVSVHGLEAELDHTE